MRYFSYNDYEDYKNNEEIYRILKLEEKKLKYETISGEINVIIEKLKNAKNVVKFLYKYFDLKNEIKAEELILYENYINSSSNNQILYKIANDEKFFYIKHISKLDLNIPFKMLNTSIEIINRWKEDEIKNKKYPIIFPIVIYTGKEEWNSKTNQEKLKIKYTTFEKNCINLSYNIVEIKNKDIDILPYE